MSAPILPGRTLGILGGGQFGRMLALAARRMGYTVEVLSPEPGSPAGRLADLEIVAPYDDLQAVRLLARRADVVTFEFENIPAATVVAAGEEAPGPPVRGGAGGLPEPAAREALAGRSRIADGSVPTCQSTRGARGRDLARSGSPPS